MITGIKDKELNKNANEAQQIFADTTSRGHASTKNNCRQQMRFFSLTNGERDRDLRSAKDPKWFRKENTPTLGKKTDDV